jgi:hypothetical protein
MINCATFLIHKQNEGLVLEVILTKMAEFMEVAGKSKQECFQQLYDH